MKNIKIQQMPDNISTKKDIIAFFNKKTECFHQMILSTLLAVQKYKILNFFSAKEFNSCIQGLETINDHMNSIIVLIKKPNCDQEDILTRLQTINNELSQIFRSYGTLHIKDLLQVCFGVKYRNIIMDKNKYKMVENFIHPIGYKIMDWKQKGQTSPKKLAKNRIVEDYMIVEIAKTLDCFDLARTSKGFQKRVYGVKIAFQNKIEKKTLIVTGIVDDLMFQSYNYPFIQDRIKSLKESIPPEPDFSGELYNNFLDLLTIKEYLI